MSSPGTSMELGAAPQVCLPVPLQQSVTQRTPLAHSIDAAATRLKWGAALLAMVLVVYGMLQNGYYVPNSDAEYYIAIARNLVNGRGYIYNGEPVGLVPPGWPVVLAAALAISDSFAVLNWLPTLMLLGSSAAWYCVMTRLTSPRRAFVVILLSATLFWGYHSAILLQSEALFCLLLALMMLLAFQVAEQKPAPWRIAALVLLCAALVSVRWMGLVAWVVPGAALLSGHIRRAARIRLLAIVLLCVTALAMFYGMRHTLRALGAHSVGGETLADDSPAAPPQSVLLSQQVVVPNVDTQQLSRNLYSVVPRGGFMLYLERAAAAGSWMSILFWMPAKLAVSSPAIATVVNICGWLLLAPLLVCLARELPRGRWVWLGVIIFCGLLVLRWSSANERYLVPVAPLLLLGPWLGLEYVSKLVTRNGVWQLAAKTFVLIPIISVAICNASLLVIDVYVARSDDFYAHHHAGRTQPLVDAAHHLNERGLSDGELAVSPLYININRPVQNSFAVRVMNLLTDRLIRTVPREVCEGTPDARLIDWAAGRGVRYYLYRPPVSPWRVWHFRMKWLQEYLTGEPVTIFNPFWELYEFKDGHAVKVDLPKVSNWPRRLPGVR